MEFFQIPPQPPELAAVLRRGIFRLDAHEGFSMDTGVNGSPPLRINGKYCQNGRPFFSLCRSGQFTSGVHNPFHPASGIVIVPPPSTLFCSRPVIRDVFSREGESGHETSYFWFSLKCDKKGKATANLYMLQDDAWRLYTSATTNIPRWRHSRQKMNSFLAIDDKVYLVVTMNYILLFDWTSSSFSTIGFPDGVDDGEILLSRANDSGLFLIHMKGLKLSIWCRRRVNGSVEDCLLFRTFCLRDTCARLRMSDCEAEDGHTTDVCLSAVGDNAEFVLLEVDTCIFYLDVRSKALHKVYEVTETDEDGGCNRIHPFMMIWPPTFPALKE